LTFAFHWSALHHHGGRRALATTALQLTARQPYTFTGANGQFDGFDVELFRDVARRLGFDKDHVTFTGQDFSALLPSVPNGRFDVTVAAIGTTEARKKTVDFSDGYLAGYLTVLSAGDVIKTPDDLAGKRLGVAQGTLQEAYAKAHFTKGGPGEVA
jgi:polar amino acid transport system substrate-binding protein